MTTAKRRGIAPVRRCAALGAVAACVLLSQVAASGEPWTPTNADDFARRAASVDEAMPVQPVNEDVAAWTRSARVVTWTYANSATWREILTAEQAEQRAQQIADWGFNTVLLNGAHYRQVHRDSERLAEIHRAARLAVEACHKRGMRVLDHNDLVVFYAGGYDRVREHPEWLQTEIRYDRPWRYYCLNDPEYVRDAVSYFREFQRATGVDGFMTDEVTFREATCGCADCRERFYREAGVRLPKFSGSPVLHNREHPLWRLWQRWQRRTASDFYTQIHQALTEDDPNAIMMSYSTAFTRPQEAASDMFSRARVVQWPGFEGTNVVYPGYRNLVADQDLRLALARAFGKYSWSQYPAGSAEEHEFSIYLSALTGQAPWVSTRNDEAMQLIGDVFNWTHWEALTHPREPVADVALVFSVSTRDATKLPAYLHMDEYYGWAEALKDRGVMYEPIIDQAADAIDLSRYRVVIVPAADALPRGFQQRLREYVAGGGRLIATGPIGVRDEFGLVSEEPALAEAIGLRSMEPRSELGLDKVTLTGLGEITVRPTSTGRSRLNMDEAGAQWSEAVGYQAEYENSDSQVLARFDDGAPAVTQWTVGEGEMIHTALLPGRHAHEPRLRRGIRIEDWLDADARALMAALWSGGEAAQTLTGIEAEGVIGAMYRDDDQLVVHLLNVGGVHQREVGSTVTRRSATPVYPETGRIGITLNGWSARSAAWFEPGTDAATELEVVREGDATRIVVPAGSLEKYGAVRITMD
ncbi:MAG: beta-galactosidase trimerization domain-containing protein [Phycisphaeraceae bacterium]